CSSQGGCTLRAALVPSHDSGPTIFDGPVTLDSASPPTNPISLPPVTLGPGTATGSQPVGSPIISPVGNPQPVNPLPLLISHIADQTIDEDTSTGPLPFNVISPGGNPDGLQISATSSVPRKVPDGNIVLGGSGALRTVTVTPAPNANGLVTITLS